MPVPLSLTVVVYFTNCFVRKIRMCRRSTKCVETVPYWNIRIPVDTVCKRIYNLTMMTGEQTNRTLCACTKEVSWFSDPPRYENKSVAKARDIRIAGGLRERVARSNPYVIIEWIKKVPDMRIKAGHMKTGIERIIRV